MFVLVWRVPKALLASPDSHPLKVVTTGQRFAQQFALAVDNKPRLARNQSLHGRGRGLPAHLEVVGCCRLGTQSQGFEVIKSSCLINGFSSHTGWVAPDQNLVIWVTLVQFSQQLMAKALQTHVKGDDFLMNHPAAIG